MKNKVCIVGLGYVGLPLFVSFSKNIKTIGYDKNKKRVDDINKLIDSNKELTSKEIKSSLKSSFVTSNLNDIKNCNIFILTIPTPIFKNKKPDLRLLNRALIDVSKFIHKNDIVVLESTVYPGFCDEKAIPLLEKYTKKKCNIDFYFGYSPERVNPGDKKNVISNISKLVSGSNLKTLNKLSKVYEIGLKTKIYKTSSIKVAESAKIIENTQRDLNIGLINEFSIFLDKMGLSYSEVMNAAATKWNFLNFNRGLVGGHCISVDPYYLIHKAKKIGLDSRIIGSGRNLNDDMPKYFANYVIKKFHLKSKSKVLLLGFAFKENCSDVRNTLVFDLHKKLNDKGILTTIVDPLIDKKDVLKQYKINVFNKLPKKKYSLVLMAKNHKIFNSDTTFRKLIKTYIKRELYFKI